MNAWAFTYNQKRLLQLLTTLSQNLENTMKYLYNKQDFFFFWLMMQATRFLRMLQKKTDKGFRVQTMQLLGEELPCQQSASNWRTAAGAGRASPECWGRSGQHGAGVWWGGGPLPCTRDADRGHGLCTDLIPLSLHFRNTISRTVGLNISGS